MSKELTKQALWNDAAKAGLIFGAITIGYMVINQFLLGKVSITITILSNVLWLAKLVGCIYLMRYLFLKLTREYSEVTNKVTRSYGIKISFLSSLLYSGFNLLYYSVISPEAVKELFTTMKTNMGSMLDSNSLQVLDSLENSYAQISFFSNFIYCFLFGIILSAILSSSIPRKDPFTAYKTPEE